MTNDVNGTHGRTKMKFQIVSREKDLGIQASKE